MKVTASDIVTVIGHLRKNVAYHYIHTSTKGQIEIVDVVRPEGPITIKRYNPSNGETPARAKVESISTQMIWRVANAFQPSQPINFDRVLGASYNTRSVLEALLVHTPQFYSCKPGRIEDIDGSSRIKDGHKHVVWCPDEPHKPGVIGFQETSVVISEIPNNDAYYESLTVPDNLLSEVNDPLIGTIDIEVQRRHAQI